MRSAQEMLGLFVSLLSSHSRKKPGHPCTKKRHRVEVPQVCWNPVKGRLTSHRIETAAGIVEERTTY